MLGDKKEKATLKETCIGCGIILVTVLLFGKVADLIFKSEKKANEARKQGYDI